MTDRMKRSDDKLKGTKDRSNFGQASNQKLPENSGKSSVDKSSSRKQGIQDKDLSAE